MGEEWGRKVGRGTDSDTGRRWPGRRRPNSARPWLQFAPARMMVFYQARWLLPVSRHVRRANMGNENTRLARRPKRCTALPNAPGRKRWYGHRERPPGPKAETGWSTDYIPCNKSRPPTNSVSTDFLLLVQGVQVVWRHSLRCWTQRFWKVCMWGRRRDMRVIRGEASQCHSIEAVGLRFPRSPPRHFLTTHWRVICKHRFMQL